MKTFITYVNEYTGHTFSVPAKESKRIVLDNNAFWTMADKYGKK